MGLECGQKRAIDEDPQIHPVLEQFDPPMAAPEIAENTVAVSLYPSRSGRPIQTSVKRRLQELYETSRRMKGDNTPIVGDHIGTEVKWNEFWNSFSERTRIGNGGFGDVFRVQDRQTNKVLQSFCAI